jgi:malate synthase
MEDAATAEICRCQLWQWIHHGATINDGTIITKQLIETLINKQLDEYKTLGDAHKRKFVLAGQLFKK